VEGVCCERKAGEEKNEGSGEVRGGLKAGAYHGERFNMSGGVGSQVKSAAFSPEEEVSPKKNGC